MDLLELSQEMLNFLNDTGQYQNFLDWAEARGFDRDDLEQDIEEKIETF